MDDEVFARAANSTGSLHSPYHYVPTKWIGILFVLLFGVSTAIHTAQAIRYRMWWLFPTVVFAGLAEVAGWAARLYSGFQPTKLLPFQIQVIFTIIAPTPLIAANFIIVGKIISNLGPSYSRLSPRWYSILFLTCDFISLMVQGAGGGIASIAVGKHKDPEFGGNIMLGGIVFQLVAISLYAACGVEFLIRYLRDAPVGSRSKRYSKLGLQTYRGEMGRDMKIMVVALAFSALCLIIRAIYRTIELADGFSGRIISTEIYFIVLDGFMITWAIYTLNIAHPGDLIGTLPHPNAGSKETLETFQLIKQAPVYM